LGYEHDGVVEQAHAGSVLYVAHGATHRVWNVGDTTARYFVWQIGGDTKKD
jgi:quercetin dioxygenase-like cupin family protein